MKGETAYNTAYTAPFVRPNFGFAETCICRNRYPKLNLSFLRGGFISEFFNKNFFAVYYVK